MANFKIGDVVQLKTGGPKMTIESFSVSSYLRSLKPYHGFVSVSNRERIIAEIICNNTEPIQRIEGGGSSFSLNSYYTDKAWGIFEGQWDTINLSDFSAKCSWFAADGTIHSNIFPLPSLRVL